MTSSNRHHTTRRHHTCHHGLRTRHASALICVLACLLISSAIVLGSVRRSLATRRETRWQHQRHQTETLLHAGIVRALTIASKPDAKSQSWRPQPISRFEHPVVTIEITDNDDVRTVHVVATIGADPDEPETVTFMRTQRSHTIQIPIPDNPTVETSQ